MEFTPINTQEEFDARVMEVYGDVKDLQGEINTHTQTIAERDQTISQLQGEIKGYKTTALKQQIAKEKGIHMDMAARLSGEDEKSLRADADAMAKTLKAYKGPAPLYDPSPKDPDPKNADMANMLRDLRGE